MTINDLLEQGITIQGDVRVSSFDADGNETVYFEKSDVYSDFELDAIAEPFADKAITFLFANDGVLHIEVSDE